VLREARPALDKIANCPMLSVARRRWIERAQIEGEPIN